MDRLFLIKARVINWNDELQLSDSVLKSFLFLQGYSLTVSKHGRDFNERVKVDIGKNSETFHLREASSGRDAGDIVHDFDRVKTYYNIIKRIFEFLIRRRQ